MNRNEASTDDGDYRIEVADFGPIVHAAVDLRPLTVFAGPSNTGKSYLAMLVYALHQCFGAPNRSRVRLPRRPYWFAGSMVDTLPDEDDLAARIAEWWSTASRDERAPLPDDLAGVLRTALEELTTADGHLAREVSRCFGVDEIDDLVRRGSAKRKSRITVNIPTAVDGEKIRYSFEFGQGRTRLFGQVPTLPEPTSGIPDDNVFHLPPSDLGHFLLHTFLEAMFRSLIHPLIRNAYYLPADRTGVMHSHQVVVSTLIQSATTAGLRPSTNVPMLSGVLADFLDDLIGMSQRRKKPSDRMARALEKSLLSGVIRLQKSETSYPSFAYRPADWDTDLPLMRTSSMVSELAPVVLYLRYLVRAEDVLIIEEPESHLHPAMQAVFARELARLVRSGVRVILTTHSEWILEALANLVRLSELPESKRKGISGSDVALSTNEVGAWMFTPNSDDTGSTVEEILLDTEAGNFPAGYGEITESLYNDWAKISNRIEAIKAGLK